MSKPPNPFDSEGSSQDPDSQLPHAAPIFLTLPYADTIYTQLEKLQKDGKTFDGLIIDLMATGFSMQVDQLATFITFGKKLLNPHGVMLFIKSDSAISLSRDDLGGGLVINVFDNPYGALSRYPLLAYHAFATVDGIDEKRVMSSGGALSNHILLSSIPVLTAAGKKAKGEYTLPVTQNWVVQLIDDYSSLESILYKLESRQMLTSQETLGVVQSLEKEGLIFPIFSRIDFLGNCYKSGKPFRLGRYLVACGIITQSQLQELLERQQEEGWGDSKRALLGVLAVRAGYINMRELQVLLADQYLYGGYHRLLDESLPGISEMLDVNTVRDSLIGSLGAIDPPGLLQSLSTAGKSGLLSSEDEDQTLLVMFINGKPTHAKMNELRGMDALIEFITSWTDGIFVFREKGQSLELDKTTELRVTLDRILLDSALFHDHINQVLNGLPQGRDSILERAKDFEQRWNQLADTPLLYLDETEVTLEDREQISRLAFHMNGLSTINEVVRSFHSWPTHCVIRAIDVLLRNGLLVHQTSSLFKPLNVFQKIVLRLREMIGSEENKVLLHSSLHYALGDSSAKDRFQIDQEGYVNVNLSKLKNSGVAATVVLQELRQWMEAYLAYCRQKVEPSVVDFVVATIIREASE